MTQKREFLRSAYTGDRHDSHAGFFMVQYHKSGNISYPAINRKWSFADHAKDHFPSMAAALFGVRSPDQ